MQRAGDVAAVKIGGGPIVMLSAVVAKTQV